MGDQYLETYATISTSIRELRIQHIGRIEYSSIVYPPKGQPYGGTAKHSGYGHFDKCQDPGQEMDRAYRLMQYCVPVYHLCDLGSL